MKVNSGWAMDRVLFSEAARKVLEIAIDHRRIGLKLPDNALRGARFGDNKGILARLESQCTEEEFMLCPGMRIDSALIDAAQSDHWYAYEYQDYDDYGPTSETEIADDE